MQPAPCPSCRQPMLSHSFGRLPQGTLELDLCFSCQGIWFDEFESAQITPGGIIELFKLIHAHRAELRLPLAEVLHCPRCNDRLLHGFDLTKNGRINYDRCLQRHGRFTAFSQFMVEKGFVRHLGGAEIAELRKRVQTIRCTGCGAPVDIRRDSACSHCRSPIVILDPQAVEQALASYGQSEARRTSLDPVGIAEAILQGQRERDRRELEPKRSGLDLGDLIVSSAEVIFNLLKH